MRTSEKSGAIFEHLGEVGDEPQVFHVRAPGVDVNSDTELYTSETELCQRPAKLTPFSYADPRAGGERRRPARPGADDRQGRVYWAAPESQFYAEPKRLAAAGYLSRQEPGRTHERTHYTLTEPGGPR